MKSFTETVAAFAAAAQTQIHRCISAAPAAGAEGNYVAPGGQAWVGAPARLAGAYHANVEPLALQASELTAKWVPAALTALDAELKLHLDWHSMPPRKRMAAQTDEMAIAAAATDAAFGFALPRNGGVGLRRALSPWCPTIYGAITDGEAEFNPALAITAQSNPWAMLKAVRRAAQAFDAMARLYSMPNQYAEGRAAVMALAPTR